MMTPLTMLLKTRVVPDVALLTTMPKAELLPFCNWVIPLILFALMLALVTSEPVKNVTVPFGTVPNAMPKAVPLVPEVPSCFRIPISFCTICIPSSKFARIPPVVMLFGDAAPSTFCAMTFPTFLLAALAPPV